MAHKLAEARSRSAGQQNCSRTSGPDKSLFQNCDSARAEGKQPSAVFASGSKLPGVQGGGVASGSVEGRAGECSPRQTGEHLHAGGGPEQLNRGEYRLLSRKTGGCPAVTGGNRKSGESFDLHHEKEQRRDSYRRGAGAGHFRRVLWTWRDIGRSAKYPRGHERERLA